MLADFVLSYVESMHINRSFPMRGANLNPADSLAFLVFQRDFRRWKKVREAN
jgi:hypothetical protein